MGWDAMVCCGVLSCGDLGGREGGREGENKPVS